MEVLNAEICAMNKMIIASHPLELVAMMACSVLQRILATDKERYQNE